MLKKGDIILIISLLIIFGAVFTAMKISNNNDGPKKAVIIQDGKIIREIDLGSVNKPEKIVIAGEYTNTILVEKDRIRFEDATCPDEICVRTGWISRKGAAAVCLPNRIIIKIEGADDKVDGSAY